MEAFCSGVNKVSRWGSRSFVPSCRPLTLTSRQSALHLGSLFVWFTTSQIHLKAIVLLWRIPRPPLLPHSRLRTPHTHFYTAAAYFISHSLTHLLNHSTRTHSHTHSAHLSWSDAEGDCYPGNRINPQIPTAGWSGSELRLRERGEREGERWWRGERRKLRNKVKENQHVTHSFSLRFPSVSIIRCLRSWC